jgi:uncharacterized repeat protein (TIGR03803 family)
MALSTVRLGWVADLVWGAIFSLTTSGYERVLHAFSGGADGENPVALIAVKGAIYGVDYNYGKYDGGVLFKLSSSDYLTVLHSFGSSGDGGGAESLIDVHGKLYGTTTYGGGAPCGSFGCGTVFRATTGGAEKVLHSFAGGSDGAYPYGSLTNVNGTLYGTTNSGGLSNQGTVFAVTTSGAEQVLYSFKGGSDGAAPRAALVNVRGTLYGTTSAGGGSGCGGGGCGTVYSIGANGYEKLLYSFIGGADGAVPMGPIDSGRWNALRHNLRRRRFGLRRQRLRNHLQHRHDRYGESAAELRCRE